MDSKSILRSSVGVTIVMVLGFFISFLKETTIAGFFGISGEVDAYNIAIQIPVLLFSFISVAVQSVVIPIYSDLLYNKGLKNANAYINNLITILFVICLFIVIIGEFASDIVVKIFAPGFSSDIHKMSVGLLRITFPTIIFSIISQVLVALLNVHKKFVLPSFAIYILNITLIGSILYLHSECGIISACIGQLAGEALRLVFLIFLAWKIYKYRFAFDIKNDLTNQTIKMSLPVFWSISIAEVNAVVNRIVGSFLVVGSISSLTYAGKINTTLMQLFVSAIATIVYPLYAESAAKNDLDQLNKRVNITLSAYALFVVPLMFFIFVFKREIITIAFARGAFDMNSVDATQELLGFYAIGLLFMSLRSTITNIFYSLKDTKTPAINATIGAVVNVALNIALPLFMGTPGLALATSITAMYITINLIRLLLVRHRDFCLAIFYKNLRGTILSSIIMFLITYLFAYHFKEINTLLLFVLGSLICIVVYLLSLIAFKVPILKMILVNFKK